MWLTCQVIFLGGDRSSANININDKLLKVQNIKPKVTIKLKTKKLIVNHE